MPVVSKIQIISVCTTLWSVSSCCKWQSCSRPVYLHARCRRAGLNCCCSLTWPWEHHVWTWWKCDETKISCSNLYLSASHTAASQENLETLSEQKRPEILRVDVIITGSHNQWPLHSCRLYPGMQSNSLAANPYTCALHRWLTACFTSTDHHVKCLIYIFFIVLVYKI